MMGGPVEASENNHYVPVHNGLPLPLGSFSKGLGLPLLDLCS
jgi:hypothetical protein